MLHTIHQGSMPCGFRQEDLFRFPPIKAYVKRDPRMGPFLAPGA